MNRIPRYFTEKICVSVCAAAACLLVGCGVGAKTTDAFYSANVDADFVSYELIVENSEKTTLSIISTGEKYEFTDDGVQQRTAEEIAPLAEKLRSVSVKKFSPDIKSSIPTIEKIRMHKTDGNFSEISMLNATDSHSDTVFCLEITDGSETNFYKLSESDYDELTNLFAACYYQNGVPSENAR